MKPLLILLTWMFCIEVGAQSLPINEFGQYFETNVVVAEGFLAGRLFENGQNWLKTSRNFPGRIFDLAIDSANNSYSVNVELDTYSQSGVFRKQSGSITYHFQLEIKDSKYRYSFSDFLFHYYATNRNLKVVDTGKTKQLEEKTAPGWQRLWAQHKNDIYLHVQSQIATLTKAMTAKPVIEVAKRKEQVEW